MASQVPSKIFIKVESTTEQQENIKNSRKSSRTLAVLQKTGSLDKENQLTGRQPAYIVKEQLIKKTIIESEIAQTPESKRKIPSQATASTSSQTSPSLDAKSKQVTSDDLTSDSVGEVYWEVLAEKRRTALEESLIENQELYERIATLEDELNQSKTMLTEARNLVEVLTEMLEEKDAEDTTITDGVDGSSSTIAETTTSPTNNDEEDISD